MANQTYERVAVDAIKPHPRNPNVGDVEGIRESIRANEWYGAIVVQQSTGFILVGNHRWLAAKAEGLEAVPVLWEEVDDVTALRILLADNELTRRGGYDHDTLDALLEELGEVDLEGSGFSADELERIERDREEEAERQRQAAQDEDSDPLPVPDDEPPTKQYAVLIMCEDEQEQRRVFDAAVKKGVGQEVRVLSI